MDYWSFQATAGVLYRAYTATNPDGSCGNAANENTLATAYDPAGNMLNWDDDSGGSVCANVIFLAPTNGPHTIAVSASPGTSSAIPQYYLYVGELF